MAVNQNAPLWFMKRADMKNKDIVNALKLIAANQEMLLSKWQEIHGELGTGAN